MMKPYAESCDQNREPILDVIGPLLADRSAVLEIGSGTGQHAVFFARRLPHLTWYASDRRENHAGIRMWLEEAGLPNLRGPLALDVSADPWPELAVDAVFSANTVHIMHWPGVEALFRGVGALLPAGGRFLLYGPFNRDGRYTAASNARFDQWLKARDPGMGVRDVRDLEMLAEASGMELQDDCPMPADNRILYWRRTG